MRAPNEVDFWRGVALVTIFINHVPGMWFERFTYRNVSISDSAELFVFLAGWALRQVTEGGSSGAIPVNRLFLRLISRAFSIYAAQLIIGLIALAMIAATAILFDAAPILEWHNAGPVFDQPIEAHIGLVLLTHQLGYFNILPLYVVLMAFAPIPVLIDRISPWLLLVLSLTLYATTLWFGFNLPTWPTEGRWFLNPFAWQAIFIFGYLVADREGLGAFIRRRRKLLRFIALPIVLAGVWAGWRLWSPSPASVPEPKLFFLFDKTFLSPVRFIQALALYAMFTGAYYWLPKAAKPLDRYLSMLGRNSLNVFCVASLLSLGGQIVRFIESAGIGADTIVLGIGLIAMGATGWLSEWRERLRPRSPAPA